MYFTLKDYGQAKLEFEKCAETADKEYMQQAQIWKWLENTSRVLGLKDEADLRTPNSDGVFLMSTRVNQIILRNVPRKLHLLLWPMTMDARSLAGCASFAPPLPEE